MGVHSGDKMGLSFIDVYRGCLPCCQAESLLAPRCSSLAYDAVQTDAQLVSAQSWPL